MSWETITFTIAYPVPSAFFIGWWIIGGVIFQLFLMVRLPHGNWGWIHHDMHSPAYSLRLWCQRLIFWPLQFVLTVLAMLAAIFIACMARRARDNMFWGFRYNPATKSYTLEK
jgi:hypothetical protein